MSTHASVSNPRNGDIKGLLEVKILDILRSRKAGASMCPSEAPRAIVQQEEDWRALVSLASFPTSFLAFDAICWGKYENKEVNGRL